MEEVIEKYSGKKSFYRLRRNLWETAICNIFVKINFVIGVLQRVCLDFKESTIVLKFPENLFPKRLFMNYFNDLMN